MTENKDPITSAHDQSSRFERRIGEADARREVIRIDTGQHALTNIRNLRQIVLADYVAGLNKAADRWTNRISSSIDFHSWSVERGIESRECSIRLVGRQIQLVTQAEIQVQLRG